jgi:hypothetical protein
MEKSRAIDGAHGKAGLNRLPLWTAIFVVLVCSAIMAVTAVQEWSARQTSLAVAETSMRNLARSLTQHVEDSFDLLDASIFGALSRLEAEGVTPDVLGKLQKVLVARKEGSKLIHGLVVADENGDWLTSSGLMGDKSRRSPVFSLPPPVGFPRRARRPRGSQQEYWRMDRHTVAPFQPPGRQFRRRRPRHHRLPVFFRFLFSVRQWRERNDIADEQ